MELPDLSLSDNNIDKGDVTGNLSYDATRPRLMNQLSEGDHDFKSSIISSDESMNEKLTKMDFGDDHPFHGA